ncbi:putative RDD family membrane protein YckC [Bacillus pakistanensis]|uniref:RDD family membrane protein YckC n=1 Tax=Rossellomorea pakistanensis TaxID=992288 RepID=A0ABS2ND13_9BACI|nr:putative RDD family membrane protein YckC [Bacillus pakistanensis]
MNQEYIDIKTPEFVALQFRPAGLGSRAAALIIDQLILWIINILLFVLLFFVILGQESIFIPDITSIPITITLILLFIINWGYFFAFEYFAGGRTIGKKAMGIRVIQENGQSITLLSSFIRNFLRIIDSLPTGYLLGIIMVFFHSKHKRIGDLVAGTIVVHERKKKSHKKTPIEKEIERRGLLKSDLVIDQWELKKLGVKEWNLVKTYSDRFLHLPPSQKELRTRQMANILLPKIGLEVEKKSLTEIENTLFVLYLVLRDEWEYEV